MTLCSRFHSGHVFSLVGSAVIVALPAFADECCAALCLACTAVDRYILPAQHLAPNLPYTAAVVK